MFKHDEGSLYHKHDCGFVKYGRLTLRAAEIFTTALIFVLLTYWSELIFVLFIYVTIVLSFYIYFFFASKMDEKIDELAETEESELDRQEILQKKSLHRIE